MADSYSQNPYSAEYISGLVELSKINAYFAKPGEGLDPNYRAISASSFVMRNLFAGGQGVLDISMSDRQISLRQRLPIKDWSKFWMQKDPEDVYEFMDDGTILHRSAPEGRVIDLAQDSTFPIERILRSPEEIAEVVAKLGQISAYLETLPPIDWSQNSSITFTI